MGARYISPTANQLKAFISLARKDVWIQRGLLLLSVNLSVLKTESCVGMAARYTRDSVEKQDRNIHAKRY
jgi:hypothetical protein